MGGGCPLSMAGMFRVLRRLMMCVMMIGMMIVHDAVQSWPVTFCSKRCRTRSWTKV
jgi:hypothetical protein